METQLLKGLSNRLLQAEQKCQPIDLLTNEFPDLTEDDAYKIARLTFEARGEPAIGFKLGYTSAAMRIQMGIRQPNFGYLTASQAIDFEHALLDHDSLIHPRVEPEIAIVVGRDLEGPEWTREGVIGAVSAVCPALEIVDTRYTEYKFKANDNVSDNSSSARFVLGPLRSLEKVGDLRLIGALLWSNGRVCDSGIGANVLGDPLNAVAWLVNKLAERGEKLPAGSVILSGGLTRAHVAAGNTTFVAEMAELGTVRLHFSAPVMKDAVGVGS